LVDEVVIGSGPEKLRLFAPRVEAGSPVPNREGGGELANTIARAPGCRVGYRRGNEKVAWKSVSEARRRRSLTQPRRGAQHRQGV